MKATKALKRLTRIEALMSEVVERFSAGTPQIRELLQDANAAVARAIEAVSLQASSGAKQNPPSKRNEGASKAKPALGRAATAKSPTAKAAKTRTPAKGITKATTKKATTASAPAKIGSASAQSGSPQFWSELDGR